MIAAVLLVLLVHGSNGQPQSVTFTHEGGAYVTYLTPTSYVEAVEICSNSTLLPSPGTLLHAEYVAQLLSELSVTQADVARGMVEAIAAVTATNPPQQEWWDVWVLDRHRPCRGATYIFEAENYFMTTDVPCEWRLCFVCAEESVARAQGYTVSAPWLAQYRAAAAAPSTYRGGPGPGPGGSGLRLVQSDLVLGMEVPPLTNASFFDESSAFWSAGPVYSAFFRGGTHSLFALRPLHEADGIDAWRLIRNQSALLLPSLYWGTTMGSWMEFVNMPAGGHDYVTAIEGCYQRGLQVERLVLYTRTGRRFQMGRGSCETRFREEAPAQGAYLAGWAGWAINSSVWPSQPPPYDFELGFLYQMRALWAVPADAAVSQRFWTQAVPLPLLNDSLMSAGGGGGGGGLAVCPTARRLARAWYGQLPAECGPGTGGLCPSNTCCGDRSLQPSVNRSLTTCGVAGRTTCQTNCIPGYGLCGLAPETAGMLFVRSALAEELLIDSLQQHTTSTSSSNTTNNYSTAAAGVNGPGGWERHVGAAALAPPAATTKLYMLLPTQQMTYAAAQAFCRSSSFMGLSDWQLVGYRDALDWTTSLDTRRGAYQSLAGLFFWVRVNETYAARAPDYACVRGVWALPRYNDRYTHMFYPSSCMVTSGVVCTTAAAQNVSRLGLAAAAAANRSALWVPGLHTLYMSRRLGTGPYGTACTFAIGATPPTTPAGAPVGAPVGAALVGFPPPAPLVAGASSESGNSSSSSSSSSGSSIQAGVQQPGTQSTQELSQRLVSVELAMAAMTPNASDYVEVVVGLQLTTMGASAAEISGRSNISSSSSTAGGTNSAAAGVGSSGGWHTLVLAPGEVVVAVSGCAGGFVERLVFHTSAGRLWSTPFGSMSVCSAPFLEQAPPGGYLVGLQGNYGSYMEQLQLVWGAPVLDRPLHSPPLSSSPPPALGKNSARTGSNVYGSGGSGAAAGGLAGATQPSGGALSGGTIAGIVVGATVGGMALLALVMAVLIARRRRPLQGSEAVGGAKAARYASSNGNGCSPDTEASTAERQAAPQLDTATPQPGCSPAPAATGPSAAVGSGAALPASPTKKLAPSMGSGVSFTPIAASLMAGSLLPMPTCPVTGGSTATLGTAAAGSASASASASFGREEGGLSNDASGAVAAGAAGTPVPVPGTQQQSPVALASAGGAAACSSSAVAAGLPVVMDAEVVGGMRAPLPASCPPRCASTDETALTRLDAAGAASGTAAAASAASQEHRHAPRQYNRTASGSLTQQGASDTGEAAGQQPPLLVALGATTAASQTSAAGPSSVANVTAQSEHLNFRVSRLGGTLQSDTAAGRAMDVVAPPLMQPRVTQQGGLAAVGSSGPNAAPHSDSSSISSRRNALPAAVQGIVATASAAVQAVAEDTPQLQPLRLGVDVVVDYKALLGRGSSGVVYRGTLCPSGFQHASTAGGSSNSSSQDGRPTAAGGGSSNSGGGGIPVAVKLLTIFTERPVGQHAAAGATGGAVVGATASPVAAGEAEGAAQAKVAESAELGGAGVELPEDDPDVRQHLRMLQQEVAVLRRLDHPNVVRLLGACLDPPRPFLVQELMTVPLSRVIHGRAKDGGHLYPYDLVDVLRIARDIATALMYLHPTVLHRDLKPGNVMLDGSGTAKVLDFGLARFKYATQLPTTNVEVGTTAYMSPESFTPTAKITDRSDIYSWAVIVVELVTRRRPWEGTRNAIIGYLVAIERQRPQLPAEGDPLFPPGLRSLVERCMRHNPEERPSSAEIVKRLTLLLADAITDLVGAL